MTDSMSPAEVELLYGKNYLQRIPDADGLPPGHVLVHNRVKPQPTLGANGFRAWTQEPTEPLVPCGCGWAPGIQTHYRQGQPCSEPQTEP